MRLRRWLPSRTTARFTSHGARKTGLTQGLTSARAWVRSCFPPALMVSPLRLHGQAEVSASDRGNARSDFRATVRHSARRQQHAVTPLADGADDGAAYLDGARMTGLTQEMPGTLTATWPDLVALRGFSPGTVNSPPRLVPERFKLE
jgi:hypothetical protein